MGINDEVSAEVGAQFNNMVYSEENLKNNYMAIIDDLLSQYSSKSELYDTQKDILFLDTASNDNQKEENDKIQLKKRKFYYKEKEYRENSNIFFYLKLLGFILSITSIILLLFKPLGGGGVVL